MRAGLAMAVAVVEQPRICEHRQENDVARTHCFCRIAAPKEWWFTLPMSLETLKREVAALPDDARRELCSFLISLREKQWAARARGMAAALDDSNSSRWLTLEEVRERLENIPEPPGA